MAVAVATVATAVSAITMTMAKAKEEGIGLSLWGSLSNLGVEEEADHGGKNDAGDVLHGVWIEDETLDLDEEAWQGEGCILSLYNFLILTSRYNKLGAKTPSITTFSITIRKCDTHSWLCLVLLWMPFVLSVTIKSIMLSVSMLNVIMLRVVAPQIKLVFFSRKFF